MRQVQHVGLFATAHSAKNCVATGPYRDSVEHTPAAWHPRTVAASWRGAKYRVLSTHILATEFVCDAKRPVVSTTTRANPGNGRAHSTNARCLARERLAARSRANPPAGARWIEKRVCITPLHIAAAAWHPGTLVPGTPVSGLATGGPIAIATKNTNAATIAQTGA